VWLISCFAYKSQSFVNKVYDYRLGRLIQRLWWADCRGSAVSTAEAAMGLLQRQECGYFRESDAPIVEAVILLLQKQRWVYGRGKDTSIAEAVMRLFQRQRWICCKGSNESVSFCHHMWNRLWRPGRSYVMGMLRDKRLRSESYCMYPDGVAFMPLNHFQCMK